MSFSDAINWLVASIERQGGLLTGWYVGITSNPDTRLFNDHGVDKANGNWAFTQCIDSSTSRQVERYFNQRGTKGDSGGGDNTSNYVYAYKITSSTRE